MTLSNTNSILSEIKGELLLSKLSSEVKEAIVLPQLQSLSRISIEKFYENSYDMYLNKKELNACKEKDLVMKGHRNLSDRL